MAIQVDLDKIVDNPYQARTTFDRDKLHSLANEMKAEGVWSGTLQGRRRKNGQIELVFGHRRLRALRLLNTKTISIELVELTDAQMALRNMEENLQREGLTDLEKADGVKKVVEITRQELKAAGKSESHAIAYVAARLGLSVPWVDRLCEISSCMQEENRDQIATGFLTAQAAMAAKEFGGDAYVKTLAAQGKEAKETGNVLRPSHVTVNAMAKIVRGSPESVRDKLKAAIIAGEVKTPAEAQQKANRLAAEHVKRTKLPPPNLESVLIDWMHRFDVWEKQMRDVIPYLEYIDEMPVTISKPFRSSLKTFLATATRLLEEQKPTPKVVSKK